MVGLDGAGKTTILYMVKLNKVVTTVPTIGFNVETVSPVQGLTFTVWDLGGLKRIRQLWHNYFSQTHGILYVVDSTARDCFTEAQHELQKILENDEMRGVPLIVLANKQDLPGAARASEVAQKLKINELKDRKCHILGTCAATGEGIYEAMTEMAILVKDLKKSTSQCD